MTREGQDSSGGSPEIGSRAPPEKQAGFGRRLIRSLSRFSTASSKSRRSVSPTPPSKDASNEGLAKCPSVAILPELPPASSPARPPSSSSLSLPPSPSPVQSSSVSSPTPPTLSRSIESSKSPTLPVPSISMSRITPVTVQSEPAVPVVQTPVKAPSSLPPASPASFVSGASRGSSNASTPSVRVEEETRKPPILVASSSSASLAERRGLTVDSPVRASPLVSPGSPTMSSDGGRSGHLEVSRSEEIERRDDDDDDDDDDFNYSHAETEVVTIEEPSLPAPERAHLTPPPKAMEARSMAGVAQAVRAAVSLPSISKASNSDDQRAAAIMHLNSPSDRSGSAIVDAAVKGPRTYRRESLAIMESYLAEEIQRAMDTEEPELPALQEEDASTVMAQGGPVPSLNVTEPGGSISFSPWTQSQADRKGWAVVAKAIRAGKFEGGKIGPGRGPRPSSGTWGALANNVSEFVALEGSRTLMEDESLELEGDEEWEYEWDDDEPDDESLYVYDDVEMDQELAGFDDAVARLQSAAKAARTLRQATQPRIDIPTEMRNSGSPLPSPSGGKKRRVAKTPKSSPRPRSESMGGLASPKRPATRGTVRGRKRAATLSGIPRSPSGVSPVPPSSPAGAGAGKPAVRRRRRRRKKVSSPVPPRNASPASPSTNPRVLAFGGAVSAHIGLVRADSMLSVASSGSRRARIARNGSMLSVASGNGPMPPPEPGHGGMRRRAASSATLRPQSSGSFRGSPLTRHRSATVSGEVSGGLGGVPRIGGRRS